MKLRTGIIAAGLLVIAGLGGWGAAYFLFGPEEKPLVEQTGPVKPVDMAAQHDTRISAIFFYPAPAGLGREEKTVAGNPLPVKMAEGLIQDYLKGLTQELRQTVVKGVYRDNARVLYVDLSDDIRRNFSGDARYEYYLVKGFYQTIMTNVPDITDVKILVEGRETESLGGHVSILRPLRETMGN